MRAKFKIGDLVRETFLDGKNLFFVVLEPLHKDFYEDFYEVFSLEKQTIYIKLLKNTRDVKTKKVA